MLSSITTLMNHVVVKLDGHEVLVDRDTRDDAARRLNGDFAWLNFPGEVAA